MKEDGEGGRRGGEGEKYIKNKFMKYKKLYAYLVSLCNSTYKY